ncbi:hypothetical protein N0V90_003427 [Kalmusia sp. IMI 367209]|nr:hypothetical protein N0V90_003427 [Kalmusia sp. IMI 367209]
MIYNEPYIDLLGGFHPCLGASARVALAPVWSEHFEPMIRRNLAGETVQRTNNPIHFVRNGFMEETYFSWNFIPVFDATGAVIAHYEPLVESTRGVIAERRAHTILQLSEEVPRARSSDAYWDLATKVMSRNAKDIPFVLLYSVEAKFQSSSSRTSSLTGIAEDYQQCTLRGSFGLPADSPAAAHKLDFNQDDGFMPYFRRARNDGCLVMVDLTDGSPTALLVHEMMRSELKQQLLATKKEVERNAMKFQRFAERADLGIFIVGTNGIYSYRNDAWWRILDPALENRDIELGDAWTALIDDEYSETGQEKFKELIKTKQHQSFELRLKRTWKVPSQGSEGSLSEEPMWILVSIQPELAEDGEMLEIVGCFQDISSQKWGEKLQAMQADNARESKRKLENFIDTTS